MWFLHLLIAFNTLAPSLDTPAIFEILRLNSKFSPQIKEQFHKTKLCVRGPMFRSHARDQPCWHHTNLSTLSTHLTALGIKQSNQPSAKVFNKKQKCSMGSNCPFAHSEEDACCSFHFKFVSTCGMIQRRLLRSYLDA